MTGPRTLRRPAVVAASMIAGAVRLFPPRFVALVKSGLKPVGRLDYRPKRVEMVLNSPWQVYRLTSCAKEPETIRWLETHLRPGDCFYDIGANVGAYSLVASAITNGDIKVFAFEPGFGTFAELCLNVRQNRAAESIVPLPVALGWSNGLFEFKYSDVTPGAARHNWGGTEAREPDFVLRTAVFRLDDLIDLLSLPLPTLLKLDVDGPELDVLRGATRLLGSQGLRTVLVELDDASETTPEVGRLLEGLGFRLETRHNRGGNGPTHNAIYVRS
jgi:FkbM family methyltransferase